MFRVHYEQREDIFLRSLYFPAEPETIPTEDEAWKQAEDFAKANKGRVVNVYVTDASHHPVRGYEARKIHNR